jgi:RNA polymerase sigma-70 factor, ECF subfamily
VTSRQDLRLALIAALQYLPGRQRAVLILRDVLMWRAAEVAELLGISTVAVNSVLQRARAGLRDAAPVRDEIREPADPDQRLLLDQYAAALQNADVAALTRLLRADAVFEMPPIPTWFAGREHIGRFLAAHVLGQPGDLRMVPTAANGQPALAAYQREADGVYRAHAVQVITCTAAGIAHIVAFRDPRLFALFGLPGELPGY